MSSSIFSGTPVNSLQLSMPWLYWQVGTATLPHSMPVLAPHSMKWKRLTEGRRIISSIVKTLGVFSSLSSEPLTIRRCLDGSTSHQPWWWRSKCSPLGVTMPNRLCSGANDTDDCVVCVRPGLGPALHVGSRTSLGLP
jgi:hypothetical protein